MYMYVQVCVSANLLEDCKCGDIFFLFTKIVILNAKIDGFWNFQLLETACRTNNPEPRVTNSIDNNYCDKKTFWDTLFVAMVVIRAEKKIRIIRIFEICRSEKEYSSLQSTSKL